MRPATDRENEIERPDILMVRGIEIPPPPGRMAVLVMSLDVVMG